MEKIIEDICFRYDLNIQEQFLLGNICKTIFRVINKDSRELVLKVGNTEQTINEIVQNKIGYERLQQQGLQWFIPEILAVEISENNFAFMLMEYCGPDILTQLKKSSDPICIYNQLITQLEKVYGQSLQQSSNGKEMIEVILDKVVEQYEKYIQKPLDPMNSLSNQLQLLRRSFPVNEIKFCCFSNWDFTPEDTYLLNGGLKYSDPHAEVLGIPIIDMACFAGVLIAYEISSVVEGYNLIQKFAINRIPHILSISKPLACRLFSLGRVLQCFLSARFRMDSNPSQAQKLFCEAKNHLEKVIKK